MASLLHVDAAGKPMVSAFIERSGLEPAVWLRRYFEAYLVPLVHCLHAYELAFMPHGENVILILADGFLGALLEEAGKFSGYEFRRTAAAVLRK